MGYKDGEHPKSLKASGDLVVTVDLEAYPEPKVLSPAVLRALAAKCGGWTQAAEAIGGMSTDVSPVFPRFLRLADLGWRGRYLLFRVPFH